MVTLACGNCVYYALWQQFPPTSSWCVIFPIWLLALSVTRMWTGQKLVGVPPLWITVPGIAIVLVFAPGILGPPLGFWIPICCILASSVGLAYSTSQPVRRAIVAQLLLASVALAGFGIRDYAIQMRMSSAERQRYVPVWEQPTLPRVEMKAAQNLAVPPSE